MRKCFSKHKQRIIALFMIPRRLIVWGITNKLSPLPLTSVVVSRTHLFISPKGDRILWASAALFSFSVKGSCSLHNSMFPWGQLKILRLLYPHQSTEAFLMHQILPYGLPREPISVMLALVFNVRVHMYPKRRGGNQENGIMDARTSLVLRIRCAHLTLTLDNTNWCAFK